MDHCTELITKIKDIISTDSEIISEILMDRLGLKSIDDLERYVEQSRIYELSKDRSAVAKKSIIRFKMVILKSEEPIDLPIARFIEPILEFFKSIPYIRFNKNIGQLIVFENDFNSIEDVYSKHAIVTDDQKTKEYKVTFNESTFDDRRSFSNEHSKHMEGILRYKYGRQTHFAVDGISIYKNGIYLGVQKFKSIKEIQSYFGKLLKSVQVGHRVPEAEGICLKELLKYHASAEKKIGDIDHFEVDKHPKFTETPCFFIVRKDGTKEDFSFNKCIKEIGALIK